MLGKQPVNATKMKQLILDVRKIKIELKPVYINGDYVESVQQFKFLDTLICSDLSLSVNTTAIIGKAQKRPYFLKMPRKTD